MILNDRIYDYRCKNSFTKEAKNLDRYISEILVINHQDNYVET